MNELQTQYQTLKTEKSEVNIDVALWNARAIEAQRMAGKIEITDEIEEGMAVDSMTGWNKFLKAAEDERKNQVEPFNKVVKAVNSAYKSITEPFESAITIVKKKRSAYLLEVDRKIAEENRKRQEEFDRQVAEAQRLAKEQKIDAPVIAPPPVILETKEAVHTSTGTASASKVWKAEVVNIEELYKARPDLVKLEPKMREINSATANGQQIPGLRVFQEYAQSMRR
jgi:hypothetical protein